MSTVFLQKCCGQWSRNLSPSKHFFTCALPDRKRLHSSECQDSRPWNKCHQQKHEGVQWGRVRLLSWDKKPEILSFPRVKSFWKWLYWEMCSTAFPCASASCLLGWVFPLDTNCAKIWSTWEKLRTRQYEGWTHKKIVTQVGFHERIYFHVKPLILTLAGHMSPPKVLDQSSATARSD